MNKRCDWNPIQTLLGTSFRLRSGLSLTILLVFCLSYDSRLLAHDSPPDWPTAEQLAAVQPALPNSIPLARRLVGRWRHRLDEEQLQQLDRIHHHLEVMQQIDAEFMGRDRYQTAVGKMQLVEYFRWQMEKELVALLDNLRGPEVIELKIGQGLVSPADGVAMEIDAQTPLVILRVQPAGLSEDQKEKQLGMDKWDLRRERPDGPFTVEVSSTRTTYLMLELEGVPADRTTVHLMVRDLETRNTLHTCGLTFQAVQRGQLALDVVNEQGQSVPVLMSIASRESGQLWEPAEAVDLRMVLNDVVPHLSPTGRGYMFFLFGQRRGRYWVVQPPLEMALPAGQWDIKVLRGLEFTPIQETVSVKADQWTRVKLQPQRWTNMSRRGWYSGDDHVHARLENSEDARKLLTYTRAVDINVANILEMGDAMRTYYPQRGYGKDFRVSQGNHCLVPGQEDPRSMLGHAIGLNLTSQVRDLEHYHSNDRIAAEIHRQGGLYGNTHVGPNACFVHREMALYTPDNIVDFNSIMQATLGTDLFYDFLDLGFRMTASAGADTPYGGTIGAVRTYAYTGNPDVFEPDDWFDAIKLGRTFVTNGPMVDFTVNGLLPGSEIQLATDEPISVKVKAWGDSQGCRPVKIRLIRLGEVVREVTANETEPVSLELEANLEPEHGFWLAAHVVAADGSQAHTTPIYLKRPGFQHWNMERVESLIERQLDTLREIETEVTKAERLVLADGVRLDYSNRLVAEQADAIRGKVEKTRAYYLEMRKTFDQERQLRQPTSTAPPSSFGSRE